MAPAGAVTSNTVAMLTAAGSGEVEDLLEQLHGPGALFVTELASRAALERPVMIDIRAAAAAVRPYAWLLGRIGEQGIALSAAGYLPPGVVAEALKALGWERDWVSARNREHLAIPVLELRHSARRLALVRIQRGTLLRTAAGARLARQPERLWWHIASRLPTARRDAERDAGLLLLLAVAGGATLGAESLNDLLRRGMTALGWQDGDTGCPPGEWEVFAAAHETWTCLRRLGVIPDQRHGDPPPRPTLAGMALARAALRTSPA